MSRIPGFPGHHVTSEIPSRTSGSLGVNDAADPTKQGKVGDTPGILGVNDHASLVAMACAPMPDLETLSGVIWILFGDMVGDNPRHERAFREQEARMREVYEEKRKEFDDDKLSVGIPKGWTTKKALLNYLADPATLAVAWHSHGDGYGKVRCGDLEMFGPADIKQVSPNLAFAAFIGCDVAKDPGIENQWIKALKLDSRFEDGRRRFTASGDGVWLWDVSVGATHTIQGFGPKFANGTLKLFRPAFTLPEWVAKLKGDS